MDRFALVSAMRRLSIEAGRAIMEVYARDDLGVRQKADTSPVTEADEAADAIISAGLRSEFSGVPLVTEEQSRTHSLAAKTFLIVDPLDGTKEFVKRRGDFTVNIALVEDGVPTLGVVYAPAKGRMFTTLAEGGVVEETGAFEIDQKGPEQSVSVSKPKQDALRVVASKSHRDQATDDYIDLYPVASTVSAGSSLKFCLVAVGEADFYPRLGPTMEWDTAAGQAVLTAAGGLVVDRDTHKPLGYGKPEFRNPHFLAFAPGVSLLTG
ncbi:MAG: 3'(2'),5'-bisphosphate nucleotidase CysQ [Silicimonas sp.]|nr:3'(2'),5'-bisphosphate nucleotidase CysQ [Silicimonas sp.]